MRRVLRDVESICRQHGLPPENLPVPSRSAYFFLKELDLEHLPLRQAGETAAPAKPLRLRNVVKLADQYADLLWQHRDAAPALATRQLFDLQRQTAGIEQLCAQHGQTPAELEAPTRQAYCWLKFLSDEANSDLYRLALRQAATVLAALPKRPALPVLVHLTSQQLLWRRREYQNALLLRVNTGFLNAELPVWRALLHSALGLTGAGFEIQLRDYSETEEFSDVLFEIEALAMPPAPATRGRAHDLAESFARVNAAYFGNALDTPRLLWNRTLTARKFGHYQPSRDTVMLSITLDNAEVSASLVDFVMYHELLHKQLGILKVNGRRVAHSPEFRAAERRFANYAEAERQLLALARRQRGLPDVHD